MQIFSPAAWTYTVQYQNTPANPGADIIFDSPPTSVVYIRSSISNHQLISTLKIAKGDFYNSLTYLIGNKTFVILDDALLDPEINWWKIKNTCNDAVGLPTATKDEYGALWEYLKANDLLSVLSHTWYLTNEQSVPYCVWQVRFYSSGMSQKNWNWAPTSWKKLDDRGLVCVGNKGI